MKQMLILIEIYLIRVALTTAMSCFSSRYFMPKIWRTFVSKILIVYTTFTLRSNELYEHFQQQLYVCICQPLPFSIIILYDIFIYNQTYIYQNAYRVLCFDLDFPLKPPLLHFSPCVTTSFIIIVVSKNYIS